MNDGGKTKKIEGIKSKWRDDTTTHSLIIIK